MTSDDTLRRTRLATLDELYDEIWEWANTKYDRHLVKRKVEAVAQILANSSWVRRTRQIRFV